VSDHLETSQELFHAAFDPYDHDLMSFPCLTMDLDLSECAYCMLPDCLKVMQGWMHFVLVQMVGHMIQMKEKSKALLGIEPPAQIFVVALCLIVLLHGTKFRDGRCSATAKSREMRPQGVLVKLGLRQSRKGNRS